MTEKRIIYKRIIFFIDKPNPSRDSEIICNSCLGTIQPDEPLFGIMSGTDSYEICLKCILNPRDSTTEEQQNELVEDSERLTVWNDKTNPILKAIRRLEKNRKPHDNTEAAENE